MILIRLIANMKKSDILYKLCSYDVRNPMYNEMFGLYDDDDKPKRSKDCSCDNCFYGRDEMAVYMLKSIELLEYAADALQDMEENGYNNSTAMRIYEHLGIK